MIARQFMLFGTLLLFACQANAYTVLIPAEKIQQKLEKKFPISRDKGYLWAELANPVLLLEEADNRIGLEVHLSFRLLETVVRHGVVRLLGEPAYDAETGEFYLHKINLTSLRLMNARQDQEYIIRKLLEKVVKKKLKRLTLYKMQETKVRDKLLKGLVQSVEVVKGGVNIHLGVVPQ